MCKLKPILERWLDDAERYLNPSSTSMTEQQLESARRRKKRTSIDSTIKGGILGTYLFCLLVCLTLIFILIRLTLEHFLYFCSYFILLLYS